jgi:hypothetical protein
MADSIQLKDIKKAHEALESGRAKEVLAKVIEDGVFTGAEDDTVFRSLITDDGYSVGKAKLVWYAMQGLKEFEG